MAPPPTIDLLNAASGAGFAAMVLVGAYRLVNRWAGQFLGVQRQQAESVAVLASHVDKALDSGREQLIAMRAMSAKIDGVTADVGEVRRLVLESHGQPAK